MRRGLNDDDAYDVILWIGTHHVPSLKTPFKKVTHKIKHVDWLNKCSVFKHDSLCFLMSTC